MHDLLPNVDLPEGLEQGQDGQVQPLPGALPIAPLLIPTVHNRQQAKHAHRQVTIYRLLQSGPVAGEPLKAFWGLGNRQ